jgi:hypothetical protein
MLVPLLPARIEYPHFLASLWVNSRLICAFERIAGDTCKAEIIGFRRTTCRFRDDVIELHLDHDGLGCLTIEFIPLKPSVAMGSTARERDATHSRRP